MFKALDLYDKRCAQITITFMIFAAMQLFLHVPHSSWLIITGAMIYSGFNPGTVIKRAYLRLYGTIVGIAAVMIVWHFMHWDYRLATLFYVLIVGWTLFLCMLPYHLFVIMLTLLSDIILQWGNPNNFHIESYAMDRFMCTFIVFGVCIAIEYVWFGRSNMSYLSYLSLRDALKKDIIELYQVVQQRRSTEGKIFKKIQAIIPKIDRLHLLINDLVYERARGHVFTPEEK
ncbi:MAG: FUSC family protein, partial [Pseudomonadota bacterium]